MTARRNQILFAIAAVFIALSLVLRPHPPNNGNTLVILSTSSPDHLDPGMSYTAATWQVMFNVYDGLLTYKRKEGAEGNELVPDLATAMPEVSPDGKVYRFTMRRGVRFSPPINREVLPSDQKWAIERLFLLASQGGGFYQVIDGGDAMAQGKAKKISGIIVDDTARTIEFRLTRPDATFPYKLALMFATVVPKEIPAKEQGFGSYVPATGPYMFTDYTPQRHVKLKRNPNFKSWSPEIPSGKVDGITIQLGPAADNSITKIRQGSADLTLSIPLQWLPRLKGDEEWKRYIHKEVQASTSYIFMNTQTPPFDNVKLRHAVNYAVDRRALIKLQGGRGEPTENILPPLMPGYKKHELYPGPDMNKAKELIAASGVKPGKISFWCVAADGPNPTAEYMQNLLTQMGFTVELKCLDYAVYFTTISNPKLKPQIGFANWASDFPEGSNFIDVLLNGNRITPEGNNNAAMYAGASAEIEKANALLGTEERNAAWAKLDEQIMRDAPWAPYSNSVTYSMTSKRVSGYVAHPTYGMIFALAEVKSDKGGAS